MSKSLCRGRGKQLDQSVKQALLPMPLSLPPVPLLMVLLSMLLHLSLLMKIHNSNCYWNALFLLVDCYYGERENGAYSETNG